MVNVNNGTTFDATKKMVSYLVSKGKNAKIKSSRYNSSIKAVEIDDAIIDVASFLKKLTFPGLVSDLSPADERSISGTYKAKLVVVNKNFSIAGFSKGDSFYLLNVHTEKGSIKSKALAPNALGLDSAEYTNLDTFDRAVINGISKLKIPGDVQIAITELYRSVSKNSNKTDTIPYSISAKNAINSLKPQDKQAVGKDFGEVLSLRWYLTQPHSKGWTRFGFETGSNAALVDYYVYKKVK
jgi:hypothetical protein